MKKINAAKYYQKLLSKVNFIDLILIKINFLYFMIIARNKKNKSLPLNIKIKILISTFCGTILLNSCGGTFRQQGAIDAPFISLELKRKFLIQELFYEENPSVMVIYASNSGRAYPWLYLRPLGVNYPSDKRALEVANRLEEYRLQKLKRLAWGTTDGQEIICAYTEQKLNLCQIVVTVAPGIDPQKVLILLQCKLKYIEEGSPLCPGPVES